MRRSKARHRPGSTTPPGGRLDPGRLEGEPEPMPPTRPAVAADVGRGGEDILAASRDFGERHAGPQQLRPRPDGPL